MKYILATLVFLSVALSAWCQNYQRNFFDTNQNPIVDVVAGANATVTPSLIGVNQRRFTVAASVSQADVNSASNVNWVYAHASSNALWIYTTGVSNAAWAASNSLAATLYGNVLTNEVQGTNVLGGGSTAGQILTSTGTGPANWSNAPAGGGGSAYYGPFTNLLDYTSMTWTNLAGDVMRWTNGNLGVGILTPSTVLSLYKPGGQTYLTINADSAHQSAIDFQTAGSSKWIQYIDGTTGTMHWFDGVNNSMELANGGALTISGLTVTGNAGIIAGGLFSSIGVGSGFLINKRSDSSPAWIVFSSSGDLQFYDNNAAAVTMTLATGGNLSVNSLATAVGNKSSLINSNATLAVGVYLWTNTLGVDAVGILNGGTITGIGVNGDSIGAGTITGLTAPIVFPPIQPGEWLCITSSVTPPSLFKIKRL